MKIKATVKEFEGEKWVKFNSSFDKYNYYFGNLITLIFIIFLIYLGISLGGTVYKYIDDLAANPFIVGANTMKGDVECSCKEYRNDKVYLFGFNKKYWWAEKTYGSEYRLVMTKDINISEWEAFVINPENANDIPVGEIKVKINSSFI